jgi:hypothetical protein
VTRRRKYLLASIAAALLAMQLVQPASSPERATRYGPVSDYFELPREVEIVLRTACYDCHSAETHWPWYSRIAPISWLIVSDVRRGRADLDFSDWSPVPAVEPTPVQRLRWTCEEPRENSMPPLVYRLMHAEARLTESEKDRLCEWSVAAIRSLER